MRQRPYVIKVAKQQGISSLRHADVATFVALVSARAVVWLGEKNRTLSESFKDDFPQNGTCSSGLAQ